MRTLIPSMLLVLLLAPTALADAPAWTDEPAFQTFCATLRAKIACPGCSCDAITQSSPTRGIESVSDFPTGLIISLAGLGDGDAMYFNQLRVALGKEGALVDVGVIADGSSRTGQSRVGAVDVLSSDQRFDMCPGMCPHEPVGLTHIFEVRTQWSQPNDDRPDRGSLDSTTDLVVCFAPDDKTPGCWITPVGAGQGTVHYDLSGEGEEKRKEKSVWSRSHKLSSSGEVTLTLGAPKGKVPAELATKEMKALPKTLHLKDLLTRPGTRAAVR